MITFSILLILLLAVVLTVLGALGALGTGILLTFGDIIICVMIIVLLCKLFFGKKKK